MNIGIDARLINQTGVGRYTRNLYDQIYRIDKRNQYQLLKPEIPWHSIKEQLFFPFWLLNKKIDLVHFTYFSFPVFCPKKFILTIHDLIPWHYATGKASTLPKFIYFVKQFFYKIILWIGARRAVKIIAVSESTKKDIIKTLHINPEKIEVIYEGVDQKLQKKSEVKLPRNFILYVGNAYPHKNLERLLQAYAAVCKKNSDINFPKLVLAGPDDYFYKLIKKQVIDMNLKDFVIFSGLVKDTQLNFLYKNAKGFVTASLSEGFGLPGLEAMSFGCPLACSDIGIFKEIYTDVPRYFNPEKIEDIQKALIWMINLSDKKRQQLKILAENRSKFFSWEKCAKKTIRIYESCFSL